MRMSDASRCHLDHVTMCPLTLSSHDFEVSSHEVLVMAQQLRKPKNITFSAFFTPQETEKRRTKRRRVSYFVLRAPWKPRRLEVTWTTEVWHWVLDTRNELFGIPGNSPIPSQHTFDDDFPFPKEGYVSSLEGTCKAVSTYETFLGPRPSDRGPHPNDRGWNKIGVLICFVLLFWYCISFDILLNIVWYILLIFW